MSSAKLTTTTLPFNHLTAISPLDGRYHTKVADLAPLVSEYALIRTRVEVEVKYLIALSAENLIRRFTVQEKKLLKSFYENFDHKQVEKVKELEEETRHDVKAMERVLRSFLKTTSLKDVIEKVHFGLTSEDINNISYRLMLYRATQRILIPTLEEIVDELVVWSEKYATLPMLARTHGQAAVPTTLGKEIVIFAARLSQQLRKLKEQKLTGKLNGAVGNFNALHVIYPGVNWLRFSTDFVTSLNLTPNLTTTQINTYDDIAEYFQIVQRINIILISFDQDMWRYISDNWFVQVAKKGEVGSSTMPQKVNPIDFENSEGNLGLANALLEYMARKLPISRMQRDLTDSTTIRNLSLVTAYSLLGYKSSLTGLSRVKPNQAAITEDLMKDWTILTEAVQTILRHAGVDDPYSLIASLSRGKRINEEEWSTWLDQLKVDPETKKTLAELTPPTYIGLAVEITRKAIKEIRKT